MKYANTPLSNLMDERGITQQELADAIGVSRQAVQKWRMGNPITLSNLKKLSNYLGVSVGVLTGETTSGDIVRAEGTTPDGYTRIPVYDVFGGCDPSGNSSQAPSVITGFLDFANWFLRSLPGVTSVGRLQIINSVGDSMEPTIADRSLAVVDRNQQSILADGVYCLRVGEQLFIKRVQRNLNGSVTLISDNPRYQPATISAGELENAEVIGRVIYAFNGRKI